MVCQNLKQCDVSDGFFQGIFFFMLILLSQILQQEAWTLGGEDGGGDGAKNVIGYSY